MQHLILWLLGRTWNPSCKSLKQKSLCSYDAGRWIFIFLSSHSCYFKCSCLINQSPPRCCLVFYLLSLGFLFVFVAMLFGSSQPFRKSFWLVCKKILYSFRLPLFIFCVWFVTSMKRSRTHNVNKTVVCLQLRKDTPWNLLVIGRTTPSLCSLSVVKRKSIIVSWTKWSTKYLPQKWCLSRETRKWKQIKWGS